ncbi:MAG: O-acetyl-ADP-ribose deacetylase [Firmicutes bacterium]|nr:O-acetyl-ADP-ribose deacetylase [Bacillota bacterium]
MEKLVNGARMTLTQGDITLQEVDAIVNAANSELLSGGGVCGAIHSAGGESIARECAEIRKEMGDCPTGFAVITGGGRLKARSVIHAVGPIWRGGKQYEDELLASAYRQSLMLARDFGISSIAFPSISTGIYGFPIQRAAGIALKTIRSFLADAPGPVSEVRMVLFSPEDLKVYQEALAEMD